MGCVQRAGRVGRAPPKEARPDGRPAAVSPTVPLRGKEGPPEGAVSPASPSAGAPWLRPRPPAGSRVQKVWQVEVPNSCSRSVITFGYSHAHFPCLTLGRTRSVRCLILCRRATELERLLVVGNKDLPLVRSRVHRCPRCRCNGEVDEVRRPAGIGSGDHADLIGACRIVVLGNGN